jgi:hypothetical protein
MKKLQKPAKAYRIDHGKRFRLKDFDPADIRTFQSQEDASAAFEDGVARLIASMPKTVGRFYFFFNAWMPPYARRKPGAHSWNC